MKKKYTREQVAACFPELNMLTNRDWAEKIVTIWKEVYERCAWCDLKEAWYNPLAPGVSLVTHTRSNVLGALALVDIQKDLFDKEICNRDILIASCLLHDVCKLLEYQPCEGGAKKNSIGENIQHGFYSAYYAEREGFPEEIISILVSHTGESRKVPRSAEGLALYYADVADADFHRLSAGRALLLDAHKPRY